MHHFALTEFESDKMFDYFTNFETDEVTFGCFNEDATTIFGNKNDNEDLTLDNENLNPEQKIAVEAILSMKVGQKPFMLHGPPPRNWQNAHIVCSHPKNCRK